MAKRTMALTSDGKIIGIESIYTVINGKQINIPTKIEALRKMSQNDELFCQCGCGTNLILVAGDRQLVEQHFRAKSVEDEIARGCGAKYETKESIDSKIVLKCWLDAKLRASDLESRVPIYAVHDTSRKYEFTFLSNSQKVGISFCRDRLHLSDEKLQILDDNSQGIRLLYFTNNNDALDTLGQYPEYMMKIQNRQGYCLFLNTADTSYNDAWLSVEFYAQDIDGIWIKVPVINDYLKHFTLSKGHLIYQNSFVQELVARARYQYEEKIKQDILKKQRQEQELQRKRQEEQEYIRKIVQARQQQYEADMARQQQEKLQLEQQKAWQEKNFNETLPMQLSQQETPIWDANGKRWIKCEVCGKIALASEFSCYGGAHHVNLGTCKMCDKSL